MLTKMLLSIIQSAHLKPSDLAIVSSGRPGGIFLVPTNGLAKPTASSLCVVEIAWHVSAENIGDHNNTFLIDAYQICRPK